MITDDELHALLAQSWQERKPTPVPMLMGAEQRAHTRWNVPTLAATVFCRGQEYWAPVRDISLAGLRIGSAPADMAAGMRGVILIPLEGHGSLAVNYEVVYVREVEAERVAGLRFVVHYSEELLPLAALFNSLDAEARV